VPLLPPRAGYTLFEWAGALTYALSNASRQNVYDNLQHVLGPQASPERLQEIARQVFRNQARNYYDLFRVPSLTPEQLEHLVTMHGWEHVEEALSVGKGLIIVSAHFGNLEVVAQAFVLRGYPVTVVAEHIRPEKLYQYLVYLRGCKGIKIIPIDSFLRPLFKALRNNEIVGLAADRNLTGTGMLIEFFGAPALLPDGPVRLALRTGAKLVPAFSMRKEDNTFELYIESPVPLKNTGNVEQDVHNGMAGLVAVLEKYIGRHPEQWVMFKPVWKLPGHEAGTVGQ